MYDEILFSAFNFILLDRFTQKTLTFYSDFEIRDFGPILVNTILHIEP